MLDTYCGNEQALKQHAFSPQEKPPSPASPNGPEVNSSNENGNINKNLQAAKEERIRVLKQQVDSLQNVILQVITSSQLHMDF